MSEPTRENHTLDWIITRSDDILVIGVDMSTPIAEHHSVNVILNMKKPPLPTKTMSFRQYKKIDKEEFTQKLEQSDLIAHPADSLDDLVGQYNKTLSNLIDKYAPLKAKTVIAYPSILWYSVCL